MKFTYLRENIRTCKHCGREYGYLIDYKTPSGFVAKVVELHECIEGLMAILEFK